MPSIVSGKRRLQGHVQQGGEFWGSDLRSGQAFQSVWESVAFKDSKLSLVDFRGSKWVTSSIRDTTLYGANFNAATVHGMTVTNCDAEQASFTGAVLKNVTFQSCRLAYSSFAGATLIDVTFSDCNLHGADLDVVEATRVGFLGCNLWSAKTVFGCAFWNSTFTLETCNRFAALLARVHPDEAARAALVGIAGENTYRSICRLMDAPPDGDTPEF